LPGNIGVEVDIHALGSKLIVVHDAFKDGLDFEKWLISCGNRFVIFNVKEEGIENKLLNYVNKFKIQNYFLLDLSFPSIMKLTQNNQKNIAVRVSEFEPIDGAIRMKENVKWIWLDCFKGFPLSKEEVMKVNEVNLKICLVSPELHGYPRSKKDIFLFQKKIEEFGLNIDAVCTKFPELW
jgi:hypothetical protein